MWRPSTRRGGVGLRHLRTDVIWEVEDFAWPSFTPNREYHFTNGNGISVTLSGQGYNSALALGPFTNPENADYCALIFVGQLVDLFPDPVRIFQPGVPELTTSALRLTVDAVPQIGDAKFDHDMDILPTLDDSLSYDDTAANRYAAYISSGIFTGTMGNRAESQPPFYGWASCLTASGGVPESVKYGWFWDNITINATDRWQMIFPFGRADAGLGPLSGYRKFYLRFRYFTHNVIDVTPSTFDITAKLLLVYYEANSSRGVKR